MTDETDKGKEEGHPFPLGLKLTLVLLFLAVLMALSLFLYLGPHATESFLERSNGLIALSRDALREMVRQNTTDSKDLLISLIRHTTDARRRHMMDLPLSLYEGDAEQIRQVVERTDAGRSKKLEDNVEILAGEMEQRSLREVDRRLGRLASEQSFMGTAFASDIRRAYLLLGGVVFLLLFLILGFGLYRGVVRPIRKLRQGTQAVARGDLEIQVPLGSRDEVGGLSRDFDAMVSQLRDSRESVRRKNIELEELNKNLEAEVAGKTRHLEEALVDLRRTQKQLIHAEKMASMGTLAGGVAHEFNNLIGGIRGCATEALDTEQDEHRREPLEVILRAASRAGEITDQLLRFSRQQALKMAPVKVTQVLEEALLLVEPDARKRGVHLDRRIEPAELLLADGHALHQVFLNLLTNALQAMPKGGTLHVDAGTSGRELVLHFKDTGHGIADHHLDRVFEPFFTTKDQEQDPAFRGSGLGLSVSYSIVEAHAGSLEVQSEEGRGTVFTVRLPFAAPPKKENAHG